MAATTSGLAEIQQQLLTELQEALTEAFTQASQRDAWPRARHRLAAHIAIAVADGLALHAMTTHQWIGTRQLTAAIDLVLDGLMPARKRRIDREVRGPVALIARGQGLRRDSPEGWKPPQRYIGRSGDPALSCGPCESGYERTRCAISA